MFDVGAFAKSLPEVDEGVACAGTALESRTYRVNGKAFVFVSRKEARLKLAESLAEAARLGCAAGANGWVKIALAEPPPANVLKRWIAESHALFGGGASKAKPARPATPRPRATKPRRSNKAPRQR